MFVNKYFHWYAASGLILLSYAVEGSQYLIFLIAYMLFFPLLDKKWSNVNLCFERGKYSIHLWVLSLVGITLLAGFDSQLWIFFLTTAAMAALPEEWFFRAYFQSKLGNSFFAILISSLVFAFAHMLTISWLSGVLVFIPSLFYGYVFKKTNDLVLVVLLHALSNLLYKLYVFNWVDKILLNF